MASYTVQCVFNDGSGDYILPHTFQISDPESGGKDTIIEGIRGDGCIVIPAGKKSETITIRGRLIDNAGYAGLTTLMTTMRTMVTRDQATLILKHYDGTWVQDWQYTVRRIEPIDFSESLRIWEQEYSIRFFIVSY